MKRFLTLLLFTCAIFMAGSVAAEDPLRINTSIKPPFSKVDQTGFFDLLLKELFDRHGMKYTLVRLPPERALQFVNEGTSDGELPRIAGLEDRYRNLVMVKEKIIDYNFVAFTNTKMKINSWDDLAGKRVGHVIGWKIFENNTPFNAHVRKIPKADHMIDMLQERRLDVALYERYAGWEQIHAHGHHGMQEINPPLAVKPMYLYLNKKNAWLADRLASTLKIMKQDGTYQRIFDKTLGKNTKE